MAHALYRFYGDAGRLLYVGITDDPDRRWKQHAGSKDWWPEVRGIAVDWYETRAAVEAAEKRAIAVEQPAHNKALRRRLIRVTPSERCWTDAEAEFLDWFECIWTGHWWVDEGVRYVGPSRYRHDGRAYAEQPIGWESTILALRRSLLAQGMADGVIGSKLREVYERSEVGPADVWESLLVGCEYELAHA